MITYSSFEVKEKVKIKRIYSFFEHDYENGYRFSGEMHNFWECVCVTRGKICAIADENVYDMKAGDLIVHKPLEFHGFHVDEEAGAHVCIFTFDMEGDIDEVIRDKVFKLSELQKGLLVSVYDYASKEYACVSPPGTQQAPFWYIKYEDLFRAKSHCLSMVAAYLEQLLLSLTEGEVRHRHSPATDAGVFHSAVDFMSAHVDQNLSVEEVAKTVGVSVSSLNRIFKKYAQVAVHRYFLLQRIKAATGLLQSGVSVSETARSLNFCSQGYFSACYKRETGKKPSEEKIRGA